MIGPPEKKAAIPIEAIGRSPPFAADAMMAT